MKDLEFRLKEYDTAVNDRAEIIREINRIEKGCLIVAGLVFSWLLSLKVDRSDHVYLLSWVIPLGISGIGGLRVRALNIVLENREKYLRELEKILCDDQPKGLFTFYHTKSKRYDKKGNRIKTFLGMSSMVYWIVLAILYAVVAITKFLSFWL